MGVLQGTREDVMPIATGLSGRRCRRALGEMVWTSGPSSGLSWGGMCNYYGNYLKNYLWFQRSQVRVKLHV